MLFVDAHWMGGGFGRLATFTMNGSRLRRRSSLDISTD
jgi:hypothetical protein